MIFLIRKGAVIGSSYDTQIADQELAKFNGQFEIYDKKDNTFFDIITVSNLAYDINKRYNYDAQGSVIIKLYLTNSSNTSYSILCNRNLNKNNFFVGENTSSQKYMYDLLPTYTTQIDKKDASGNVIGKQYEYLLDCTKITYNITTGRVNELNFKLKKIS